MQIGTLSLQRTSMTTVLPIDEGDPLDPGYDKAAIDLINNSHDGDQYYVDAYKPEDDIRNQDDRVFPPRHSVYGREGDRHPQILSNHDQHFVWAQTMKEMNYFRDRSGIDGGRLMPCLRYYWRRIVWYSPITKRS